MTEQLTLNLDHDDPAGHVITRRPIRRRHMWWRGRRRDVTNVPINIGPVL